MQLERSPGWLPNMQLATVCKGAFRFQSSKSYTANSKILQCQHPNVQRVLFQPTKHLLKGIYRQHFTLHSDHSICTTPCMRRPLRPPAPYDDPHGKSHDPIQAAADLSIDILLAKPTSKHLKYPAIKCRQILVRYFNAFILTAYNTQLGEKSGTSAPISDPLLLLLETPRDGSRIAY